MYAQFFNLREMPFTITPDPSYLYLSPRHQEALGHLLYGTGQYGGFVQLTGEVGTGKTTVVRTLLEQKLTDVDVAMIHNPSQNELQFVQSICDELGVVYDAATLTLKTLVDALNVHLLAVHAAGRRTVLIIDEAQNLPRDVLEQVRLLTNLETHKEKLLRIMLVGQPELSELLARPDLRQLASRITARYHLMPLSETETGEYIRHRLRVAGSHEDIFSTTAVREIHRAARGVPRLINILCDRALLGAYAQGARRVTPETVRKAAGESIGLAANSGTDRLPIRWRPSLLQIESALAVVALVIAGLLLYRTFAGGPAADPAPVAAAPQAPAAAPSGEVTAAAAEDTAALATPSPAVADEESAQATPATATADLTMLLQSAQPLTATVSQLIRLWDQNIVIPRGANVCRELSTRGLECYRNRGEWSDLRSINRPAILSLTTGRGEVQHVLLRQLTATTATLETRTGPITIALDPLDALWSGDYLLLWKRETDETYLSPGVRSPAVVWVRRRLARDAGKPLAEPVSDLYDAPLVEQIKRFQTQRELDSDGVIGTRTWIALGTEGPDGPLLATPR